MALEVAVQLKASLVHMVWIDGTYDTAALRARLKQGRISGIDFGWSTLSSIPTRPAQRSR
jgi:acetolactate synthase I/II/III large subunit